MANISFNPALTTAPQNSFLLETQGYVQGAFMDDPSSRMYLAGGVIASGVTQPMWGGMAITESIPALNSNQMGATIGIAATEGAIAGFSVFNQGYNGIITPNNNVPQYDAGMTLMYFRLGSGARIAVQCDSNVAAAVDGNATNTPIYWDFTTQSLTATAGTALPVKVLSVNTNSKVVLWNSGTGSLTWVAGTAAIIQI